MTQLLNIVTVIGALLAGAMLFLTMASAQGAPQEAAGAAFACALVIIPYSLASISARADIARLLRQQIKNAAPPAE